MDFSEWDPIWDTLNLVLLAAPVGVFLYLAVMTPVMLWRRHKRRYAPTFHERLVKTWSAAERKVQADQLAEMKQAGPPLWEPDPLRARPIERKGDAEA